MNRPTFFRSRGRLAALILLPFLTAAVAYAQPKIEIVGGLVQDFGKTSDNDANGVVKIMNAGNDTLRLVKITPSCHCTTGPFDKIKKTLGPGETVSVDVTMDVKGRMGEQKKFLTIISNDPDPGRDTIRVTVATTVVRDLEVWPVMFPVVQGTEVGVEKPSEVTITNTGTEPATLEVPTVSESPDMKVRFSMTEKKELQPGEKFQLQAFVTPLKTGAVTGQVIVRTSSPNMPELNMGLFTNVREAKMGAASGAAPVGGVGGSK